jgi:hypothetical protein
MRRNLLNQNLSASALCRPRQSRCVGQPTKVVTEALRSNAITVLNNAYVPIERAGARFWLAGLDDPVEGVPDPELAIPQSIRNMPHEPIVLLCHAPDYVDDLLTRRRRARAVSLMLSGHTHGGQVRLPLRCSSHSCRRWAASMSRAGSALKICNSTSIAGSAPWVSPSVSTARQRLRFSRCTPREL